MILTFDNRVDKHCWDLFLNYNRDIRLTALLGFTREICTYLSFYLPNDLILHARVLLQQQEHEEQTDGKRVRSGDHHLQHALSHIICRQLAVVLRTNPVSYCFLHFEWWHACQPQEIGLTWANINSVAKSISSNFSVLFMTWRFFSTRFSISSWSSFLKEKSDLKDMSWKSV